MRNLIAVVVYRFLRSIAEDSLSRRRCRTMMTKGIRKIHWDNFFPETENCYSLRCCASWLSRRTPASRTTILSGRYDHASGLWLNDYVITGLTQERMVWTVLGDPESYYVYETCPEIPADRLPDVKSM